VESISREGAGIANSGNGFSAWVSVVGSAWGSWFVKSKRYAKTVFDFDFF